MSTIGSESSQPTRPRRRRPPLIGPRSAGLLMTPREFDRHPCSRWVEGYRYELIRGVLVVTPPPRNAELDPNEELGHLLWLYKKTHPNGSVIDAQIREQTARTPANRRRADRAIWIGLGHIPDLATDFPAILVEFVSPSRRAFLRDYEEKRDEYLAAGAKEYWIVDRFRRTMTVYRSRPDGMLETKTVESSQTYQTELLPGFVLPLERLLAKADDWSRQGRRTRSETAPSPRRNDGGAP